MRQKKTSLCPDFKRNPSRCSREAGTRHEPEGLATANSLGSMSSSESSLRKDIWLDVQRNVLPVAHQTRVFPHYGNTDEHIEPQARCVRCGGTGIRTPRALPPCRFSRAVPCRSVIPPLGMLDCPVSLIKRRESGRLRRLNGNAVVSGTRFRASDDDAKTCGACLGVHCDRSFEDRGGPDRI